jgi:hypothetical protein
MPLAAERGLFQQQNSSSSSSSSLKVPRAIRTIYYIIKVSIYLGKFSRLAARSCAAYYVSVDDDDGDGYGYDEGEADCTMCGIFLLKLGVCEGGNVNSTARGG